MNDSGLNPNDPIAQALAHLRKAGANPVVNSVSKGRRKRSGKAIGREKLVRA